MAAEGRQLLSQANCSGLEASTAERRGKNCPHVQASDIFDDDQKISTVPFYLVLLEPTHTFILTIMVEIFISILPVTGSFSLFVAEPRKPAQKAIISLSVKNTNSLQQLIWIGIQMGSIFHEKYDSEIIISKKLD